LPQKTVLQFILQLIVSIRVVILGFVLGFPLESKNPNMKWKLEVHELFPTPLWAVDIPADDAGSLNTMLITEIEKIITPRPKIAVASNWQTPQDLHKRPAFAGFAKLVEMAAGSIAQSIQLEQYPMIITGCWANINPTGSYHPTHNHPNNYLSGVYYVAMPDVGCNLVLQDPRPGILMPGSQLGRITANVAIAEVKPGRMVFFPSWLRHSVPANEGHSERVSIAFNLMFANFAETIAAPTWKPSAGIS